jgi:hypothetical protein
MITRDEVIALANSIEESPSEHHWRGAEWYYLERFATFVYQKAIDDACTAYKEQAETWVQLGALQGGAVRHGTKAIKQLGEKK